MSFRSYEAGETVLIRATVVDACSDCFSRYAVARVVITDFPAESYSVNTFAPFSEIARPDDIARLLQPRTIDPTTAKRPSDR